MAHLQQINRELAEAGEYVDVVELIPPKAAKVVRAGKGGEPITDGPFAPLNMAIEVRQVMSKPESGQGGT
ncbi:MAG: hypothetical protein ABJE47_16185 [bacterium]